MSTNQSMIDGFFNEEKYSFELLSARFKNLGKEKFQDYIRYDLTPVDYVKQCVMQFAAKIPKELGECPVLIDNLPVYWLTDLPILIEADEYFRRKGFVKLDGDVTITEIRKHYAKWVMQKNDKDREFFALATINLVERNTNKNNFVKMILAAIILAYDKRINSYSKANEYLNMAFDTLINLDIEDEVKNDYLYHIQILNAFIEMKQNNYNEAKDIFIESLNLKETGITSLFYLALCYKEIGSYDFAIDYINKLLQLDLQRLEFAISKSKLELFNLFLHTAFIYNIFKENKFSGMLNYIETFFDSLNIVDRKYLSRIHIMLGKLEDFRLKDYYTEQIITEINFLDLFIEKNRNNQNLLVYLVANIMNEKFTSVTEMIINTIKENKLEKLKDSLRVYDLQMNDTQEVLKFLRKANGEKRELIIKKNEETVTIIEEEYVVKFENVENMLKKLDTVDKFDTGKSFNNTMFYNLVISLMIFVVGGFGSSYLSGDSSVSSSISDFIINGIKWGGITFFLGFIVSLFSAANTITDKASEKKRLEKKMEYLKLEREQMIKEFREEGNEKLKNFDIDYRKELDKEEGRLDKLKTEKNFRLQHLNDQVEEQIKEYREQMDGVFKI